MWGQSAPTRHKQSLELGQPVQGKSPKNQKRRNGRAPEECPPIVLMKLGLANVAQGPIEPSGLQVRHIKIRSKCHGNTPWL